MTPEQQWNRLGSRARAFVLACTPGSSPRGREHTGTIQLLLKARVYRYNRLTPFGQEVAEHGRAQGAEQ